jgi:cupin superfamily acireductone dioxygenase involved in methionine salvage
MSDKTRKNVISKTIINKIGIQTGFKDGDIISIDNSTNDKYNFVADHLNLSNSNYSHHVKMDNNVIYIVVRFV